MTDLDELEKLLEQATPGPWEVLDLTEEGCEVLSLASSADPHCVVARIANVVSGRAIGSDDRANAALIAALRNHAEELVRDARRMEWAEKHMNAIDTVSHPDNLVMIWHGPHETSAAGRTLRAAIDAAIAQEQP
jgi:hypothetical protein